MYALIEKSNQCNVSKKQFCQQEGIPLSVFYYWQKKYKQASQAPDKGFLPVGISSKPQARGSIEITFPNGVILRLEEENDLEMICSLITSI